MLPKTKLYEITAKANLWKTNPSDKIMTDLINLCIPIIQNFVGRTCQDSKWDKDELYSILLTDTYKLVSIRWTPSQKVPFHALFLRNLQNKTRNFVKNQALQKVKNLVYNAEADKTVPDTYRDNPLEAIIKRESADRLIKYLRTEKQTGQGTALKHREQLLRIVEMILEGYTPRQIRIELGLHHNSLNIRMKTIRSIMNRLNKSS